MSAKPDRAVDRSSSAISGVREAGSSRAESAPCSSEALRVGRYLVQDRIAAGGMATVHIGRLRGAAGFSRTVAIKRLLPQFARNPEFESLFVQEARLAARIQHPNVVATLDVVAEAGELILVMDYVQGETLARLMQAVSARSEWIPQRVALAILRDTLAGLHAAHEARDRRGEPLHVVHRDISPQNLMVGSDGVARVLDFGVAKAATSLDITRDGLVRGKAAYMAPEQLFGSELTRRADIYAMGVVLWEVLVGERLFPRGARPELDGRGEYRVPSPSQRGALIDPALEAIVMRALEPRAGARFETAQQMLEQLTSRFDIASREEVASWVELSAREDLMKRAAMVARAEASDLSVPPPPSISERADGVLASPEAEPVISAARPARQAPQRERSRALPGLLSIAATLGACAGVATAIWVHSELAIKVEQSVAAPTGPTPGVLDKNPERPLVKSRDPVAGSPVAADTRAPATSVTPEPPPARTAVTPALKSKKPKKRAAARSRR